MTKAEDVLTTGTLLWIKAGHRGVTAVPLEVLTEEQKTVLRAGINGGRYSTAFDRRGSRKSHYEWAPDSGLPELSIGDIELSPEQKKRLQPLAGRLPPRALGLVMEWAALHQDELRVAWDKAAKHEAPGTIPPLE